MSRGSVKIQRHKWVALLQILGYDGLIDFSSMKGRQVSARLEKHVHAVYTRGDLPVKRVPMPKVQVRYVPPPWVAGGEARTLLCRVNAIVTSLGGVETPPERWVSSPFHLAWCRSIAESPNDGRWRELVSECTDVQKRRWANQVYLMMRWAHWGKGVRVQCARLSGGKLQIVFRRSEPASS